LEGDIQKAKYQLEAAKNNKTKAKVAMKFEQRHVLLFALLAFVLGALNASGALERFFRPNPVIISVA